MGAAVRVFAAAEPRRADMGRYMGDAKQLATGALSGGDGGTILGLCYSTLMMSRVGEN